MKIAHRVRARCIAARSQGLYKAGEFIPCDSDLDLNTTSAGKLITFQWVKETLDKTWERPGSKTASTRSTAASARGARSKAASAKSATARSTTPSTRGGALFTRGHAIACPFWVKQESVFLRSPPVYSFSGRVSCIQCSNSRPPSSHAAKMARMRACCLHSGFIHHSGQVQPVSSVCCQEWFDRRIAIFWQWSR